MEPKFQTSFIPQRPINTGLKLPSSKGSASKTVNIFNIIATVVFIATLLILVGLFVYKKVLNNQITQEGKSLTDARNAFDFGSIQNLVNVSTRLNATKQLLSNHIAVSGLFNLLQSLTVQKVSFNNFTYNRKDRIFSVSMSGEAQGYDTIAAQANIFAQNSFIQNPSFSNFDLSSNGNVTFKFDATIDPGLVSYKQTVAAIPDTSPQPPAQPAVPVQSLGQ